MEQAVKKLLEVFSGATPLFPLPDFVFFPQTVQPFHVYEPRYVQLVKDCLAGERLVTILLLKPGEENSTDPDRPPYHRIATMGYINKVLSASAPEPEASKGGERFNIWITGLVKVEVAEVESDKPYRRGVVTPVPEYGQVPDAQHKRETILRLFQTILERTQTPISLENLSGLDLPLGMLAHVVISALPIPPDEKQKMLELQSLELRIDILINFMETGLHTLSPLAQFDPILPANPLWN